MKNEIKKIDEITTSGSININLNPEAQTPLISDEKITSYYEEAIENIRDDRKEAHDMYVNFCEMVINEGDPSSASKEALVNLLKLKSDSNDKMIKILDLWTRMKLRDRDTMKGYIAVQQNNKIDNTAGASVRKMIQMVGMEENNEQIQ